jgi:hypothetical protein
VSSSGPARVPKVHDVEATPSALVIALVGDTVPLFDSGKKATETPWMGAPEEDVTLA